MESRSWTVTYRNRDNGQRITAAVFAADPQQAQKKAQADGQIDGREVWEVESVEPHEETLARILIAEFSKTAGRAFCLPPLWEDDDGRGKRHTTPSAAGQRSMCATPAAPRKLWRICWTSGCR